MKFIDYLCNAMKEELEFDLIVGDVEMPATVCLSSDMKITDYMKEKYGLLLESDINILQNDVIEILCDNYKIGEVFCWDMAGYCSISEYEKLTESVVP